jgi:FlaA1/EpsC-like NDP-sugar epimerase/lipopolysaccharide/colanic/teichoic acid biosynthesis glycosyltransferase
MMKRCCDLVLACIGLMLVLPLFPFIGLLIKLDSRGPVLYRCNRIGKDGKPFKMYKFRTMLETTLPGPSVCPQGDPRVTRFGYILRRTKINELPQLLNVLKGEMTFVGPRPEAPDLAALYPDYARAIFTVTPGLVGPNQILGRNEEEWYPPDEDPQQYYIQEILPKKLPLDLEYVRHPSLVKDMQYLVLGIKETVCKAISWKLVLQNKSQIHLLGTDVLLSMISFGLAHLLRFEELAVERELSTFLYLLLAAVLIRLPCFVYFGLYRTLIRYISYMDILNVLKAILTSSMLFIGLTFLVNFRTFPRSIVLIDGSCLFVFMTAVRLGLRLIHARQGRLQTAEEKKRRVFIFGAGNAGALVFRCLRASQEAYEVIGFLDDDPAKRHKTLYGCKILGNRFNLEALVQLYQAHEVLLALPSAPARDIAAIVQACQHVGVPYRFFPMLSEGQGAQRAEPLFETPDVPLTSTSLPAILTGKRVLVAGTSGAVGLELCRQILRFAPERLLVLERYEPSLTALVSQLQQTFPTARITPILCPPAGNTNLEAVFAQYGPHVVFQNAMRKYLPFFDFQTASILHANYLTTFALAKQAVRSGCTHFVLVSSEAAHKRGNLIADSLRAVEIGLRHFFAPTSTRLVIVRLCDVLENRGGIVARLEGQIANCEPIILSYSKAKHALLSKDAAVHFILDALGLAESLAPREGIFVCPPASAVSLLEVAQRLAMLHGYRLGTDIPLYFLEEPPVVSSSEEAHESCISARYVPTANPSISLLQETPLTSSHVITTAVQELLNMQEGDLAYAGWECLTRTLLECAAQGPYAA